jgi:hypothetical protein
MSTSRSGSTAGYVSVNQTFPVRFQIKILFLSIIYVLITVTSHKHIHDVTNLLLIVIFWIKLLLKMPKTLTRKSLFFLSKRLQKYIFSLQTPKIRYLVLKWFWRQICSFSHWKTLVNTWQGFKIT